VSKAPEWHGVVTADEKILLDVPKGFRAYKRVYVGKRITMTLSKERKKATRKQHGWYRGYALPTIADHIGEFRTRARLDAIHDALMRELVGLKPDSPVALKIRASSADMDTVDFNDALIEKLQVFCVTELGGLILNDPNPEWKQKRARRQREAA
jgi:hypothetical protein